MMPVILIICIGLALAFFGISSYWFGRSSRSQEVARLERDNAYFRSTYLHKSGWSQGYGAYSLLSVDSGATWVALDADRKIIGPADPNLLAHLNGIDALTKYVEEHGPIGSRPITDKDIEVLQGAGFELVPTPVPAGN